MSLTDRLASIVPNRTNHGCETCKWLSRLTDSDRNSFDEWVDGGNSISQLWRVARSLDTDPLDVSLSGLRHHMQHHRTKS